MKKHFLTLITALLLIAGGLLVCGCEKEPPPPPEVEPELQPTLELSVTPEGVIPYGDKNVVLNWTTTNANQVLVNGERQPSAKTGIKTICNRIFKDTTFLVKAINIKKFVEKEVTIPVGDWTTSTFGLVSYYPKRYKALGVSSMKGEILDYWIPDPELLSWIFYYHRDGRLTYSPNLSNKTVPWYINKNTIIINGATYKLQVNQEEMVMSYEVYYDGQPAWFDMYLENVSDVPTD